MPPHTSTLTPGFLVLHGNRLEDLARAVITWLRRTPLDPLEEEVVLVQSNGMAEWFKMELARQAGVCASTRVELPNRFLWSTYRRVLAPAPVPRESPLDKVPMTWRLMHVLPGLLDQDGFAPVRAYLQDDGADRLLPLAGQLADVFDQYQIYRADWLEDWAAGHDQLRRLDGHAEPVPDEQRWQPRLWRAVLSALGPDEREAIRPRLHQQAVQRLQGAQGVQGRVVRRVVLFGMNHLPASILEAVAALSRHSQVLLAVPNPCRHYWGDIIEGRELLRAARRRQAHKAIDLSSVDLQDMHLHAHPLLAAWGRQSRDGVRLLDAHDDAEQTRRCFNHLRLDHFDSDEATADTPMLRRIQQHIRDLDPVPTGGDPLPLPAADRSVVFHMAHGPVRELEILHDQLLCLIQARQAQGQPLALRDIVVMVPDIGPMAPAIRAVFDQYPRDDARHIPYGIADLGARAESPLIGALEWVLRLPAQRSRLSELVDLLEVPALARRLGLSADQLPRLTQWMSGAGIRWGLNHQHRDSLGLGSCGEPNSVWFGLQRMLLGYASGSLSDLPDLEGWDGIEPYEEIGGLEAELAGVLAHLVHTLLSWWSLALQPATPAVWVERGRQLLHDLFTAEDEVEREALAALQEALVHWAQACQQAHFTDALPWSVFEQAWLDALRQPSLHQRFRAGGVTFCSLMPMRAIPFEVVCLLGMNDGDYPRHSTRNDFDLMGLAGQYRPGDRSRQLDDRQLMLDALLSARQLLYVSWTGFSTQDNSEQPPSVLVSQLRDHISAMWTPAALEARTTRHPLQPFSRRYFERGATLPTFAHEWHALHGSQDHSPVHTEAPALPAFQPDPAAPLTLSRLVRFLRNPVQVFFRERLGVVFNPPEQETPDEELFTVDPLLHHGLIRELIQHWPEAVCAQGLPERVPATLERLRRSGALPLAGFGVLRQTELQKILGQMALAWQAAGADGLTEQPRLSVLLDHTVNLDTGPVTVSLRDWIEPLYRSSAHASTWLQLEPSRVLNATHELRPDRMLNAWVRSLAAAACGHAVSGRVVAQDATVWISPMDSDAARAALLPLLEQWQQGMQAPLPLPANTALAWVGHPDKRPQVAQEAYEGSASRQWADNREPCLARLYPDWEALTADGRLQSLSEPLYRPLFDWMAQYVRHAAHGHSAT